MDEKLTYKELEYQVKILAREGVWRRQAVKALEESEEKYRQHFENAFDVIFSIDRNFVITAISPSVERTLGYRPEELIGKTFQDLKILAPEYMEKALSDTKNVLAGERFPLSRYEFISKDGTRKFAEVSGAPIIRDGKIVAMVSVARDISERLRVERSLEVVNRSINNFVTRMSHGIRSPMNAVMGMADLLRETPLTDDQRRFLETIISSSKNILQLINDILDLSMVEAGQIKLKRSSFNLMKMLKNSCEAQALRAQGKALELVWRIDPDIEIQLIGDSVRLNQILSNLIGNAIKFTEKGDIFVEAKQYKDPQQKKTENTNSDKKQEAGRSVKILFSVTDTGIGISPEMEETIFDRFTQVNTSITGEHGGTGLGLAIAHGLVELMGGHIWVESKLGHGSTFFFTASFKVQSDEKSEQTHDMDLAGVKTLIIDDNPKSRMVLSMTLSTAGALVEEKEDGKQGLVEMKRAIDTGDPYALILLDSQMPGIDGFQVVKIIKKNTAFSSPIIMLLTLKDRKSGKAKCKSLGITDYLIKPVNRSDLNDTIMVALGRKKAIERKIPKVIKPNNSKDLSPLNILLVEDNATTRILIQTFLKNTPYKINMAENGKLALEKFKAGNYNLVLMDIQMPVMDGYTSTKKIREWEKENRLKKTPIIALTAHALKKHIPKSLDAGCNAHLTKPINKADLLVAIEKYTQHFVENSD